MGFYDALNALSETGIPMYKADLMGLSEAAQLKVADDVLGKMLKFITDKYNSLDFSEIEKSAGDIRRFKYTDMMIENTKMLHDIYETSSDPGAAKYVEVTNSIQVVLAFLENRSSTFSNLYKSGNGLVQLLYTSLVAGCLYAIGVLVSNTIRFVTVEQETDCQVLFDEIPGSIKHVHIRNIQSAAHDIPTMDKLLTELEKNSKKKINESVAVTAGMIAILAIGGIIILVPRIIVLIREIIYSVYYTRVRLSEMLDLQAQLIRTNIESLEAGRGKQKVIARQKKIAEKLERWKTRIAIKLDTAEAPMKMQKKKEDKALELDRGNPIVKDAYDMDSPADQGLLL